MFGINSLFISYKNNNLEFKLSDIIRLHIQPLRGRYFYQSNESASIRTEVKLVLEELEVRPVDFVQLRQLLVRELGEVLDPGFRGERPPMSGTVLIACSDVLVLVSSVFTQALGALGCDTLCTGTLGKLLSGFCSDFDMV